MKMLAHAFWDSLGICSCSGASAHHMLCLLRMTAAGLTTELHGCTGEPTSQTLTVCSCHAHAMPMECDSSDTAEMPIVMCGCIRMRACMHAVPANDAHASDSCSQSAFADMAMTDFAVTWLMTNIPTRTFNHIHDH